MIFSVYNPAARCFDYYEAPGTSANYGARGTRYRPLNGHPQGPSSGLGGGGRGLGPIGFAPEALGMPLPSGARQVGRGGQARGVIAVDQRFASRAVQLSGVPEAVAMTLGIDGLGDVDAGASAAAAPPGVVTAKYPLGQVLVAACVASVVGVIVQKILK